MAASVSIGDQLLRIVRGGGVWSVQREHHLVVVDVVHHGGTEAVAARVGTGGGVGAPIVREQTRPATGVRVVVAVHVAHEGPAAPVGDHVAIDGDRSVSAGAVRVDSVLTAAFAIVVAGVQVLLARAHRVGRGHTDAGIHAPSAWPAHPARSPPAGARLDGPARCRPYRRCPGPHEPVPSRRRSDGRYAPSDRPRTHREPARLPRSCSERDGRGQHARPPVRGGQRLRHRHDPPVPPGGGDGGVVEPGVSLHPSGRRLRHRLLHHAAEAQPRRRRARPRQVGPRVRQSHRAADHGEGPAARLQPRPAGRPRRPVRRHRHHPGVHPHHRRRLAHAHGERTALRRGAAR